MKIQQQPTTEEKTTQQSETKPNKPPTLRELYGQMANLSPEKQTELIEKALMEKEKSE